MRPPTGQSQHPGGSRLTDLDQAAAAADFLSGLENKKMSLHVTHNSVNTGGTQNNTIIFPERPSVDELGENVVTEDLSDETGEQANHSISQEALEEAYCHTVDEMC